jgi:hypothetical protein
MATPCSLIAVIDEGSTFEPIELVLAMVSALSPFFQDHSFDPFLFAAIGEEPSGMLLTMLSALARLDLDPWFEAAKLSRPPAPAATERLTSLLSALPNPTLNAPAPAAVKRWIGLLPQAARDVDWAHGAAVVTRFKKSWPVAALLVLAVGMMLATQLAERRGPNGLTSDFASSASGAPERSTADARRE